MGRKSKNIKIELNRRIDELLRIGEKKVKDDKDNPNRAEGIHSIRTADTYRSIAIMTMWMATMCIDIASGCP